MSIRFAPSPTGTFHIGNLRTAWISHWWALSLKLPWVVRFEDIDKPRSAPGAKEKQLADMQMLKMTPDQIVIQSKNFERHWQVFLDFHKAGFIYPCFCSRKMIHQALENMASAPHQPSPQYNGRCRHLLHQHSASTKLPSIAWRLKMPDESGNQDFIIARTSTFLDEKELPDKKSFVPAYHWACAIDDYDGKHTLLVRAWDLEHVTTLQRNIQEKLGTLEKNHFSPPAIFHCSLIVDSDDHRLEKRSKGVTLDELLTNGETPHSIVEKFNQSFECKLETFKPGLVFGEARKKLKLTVNHLPRKNAFVLVE